MFLPGVMVKPTGLGRHRQRIRGWIEILIQPHGGAQALIGQGDDQVGVGDVPRRLAGRVDAEALVTDYARNRRIAFAYPWLGDVGVGMINSYPASPGETTEMNLRGTSLEFITP